MIFLTKSSRFFFFSKFANEVFLSVIILFLDELYHFVPKYY